MFIYACLIGTALEWFDFSGWLKNRMIWYTHSEQHPAAAISIFEFSNRTCVLDNAMRLSVTLISPTTSSNQVTAVL